MGRKEKNKSIQGTKSCYNCMMTFWEGRHCMAACPKQDYAHFPTLCISLSPLERQILQSHDQNSPEQWLRQRKAQKLARMSLRSQKYIRITYI